MSRRELITAVALVALTAGGVLALMNFRVDPDLSRMFPQDSEIASLLRSTDVADDASRTLFLVVSGQEIEAELPGILEELRASPHLARVDGSVRDFAAGGGDGALLGQLDARGLRELQQRLSAGGRAEAIAELRARLAADPMAAREVALRDPLGLRWIFAAAVRRRLPDALAGDSPFLLSGDGGTAVIRVVGKRDPFDVDYSRAVLADLRARLAGHRFEAIGGYAIAVADATRIRGDLERSLWFSVPLILLFLGVSLRSLWLPHVALLPIAASITWTLGYGGWILGPLTPLAASAAAILIGLGIDYSLHFLGRFREEWPAAGFDDAVRTTRRRLARALLGGMLTTVAAFLTATFGDFPALRDLGLLLGMGLVFALIATWWGAPLLLRAHGGGARAFPTAFATGVASRVDRSRLGLVAAAVVVLAAGAGWASSGLGGLRFDADPRHLRPGDAPGTGGLAPLEEVLGFSPYPLTLIADRDADVQRLRDGIAGLREQGVIGFSTGAHLAVRGEEWRARVAGFRARSEGWADATLEELAAAGFRRAPFEEGVRAWERRLQADPETDAGTDGALLEWQGERHLQARLFPARTPETRAARAHLRERIRAALDLPVRLVSPWTAADELGPALKRHLEASLAGCALTVVLILLVVLRSARAALVALLPALCGLGACLGVMAVAGWVIHPGNLLALPLVLGLGVDDGIHMVLRAREEHADPITTTGSQIWRTTVTTALGFGSLVTAASPAIASLGGIVLVGTITCFLASVLLVPRATRWLCR